MTNSALPHVGTIHIVDDDEDVRSSLGRSLRLRGHEVCTYPSGSAFLRAVTAQTEGVLILDHGMPDISGLEVQDELAARGYQLPIIFVTGHGGVPESVRAIKRGALDFLQKPYRLSDLLERIEHGFQIERALAQSREGTARHRALFGRLTGREMEIVERMVAQPSATSSKEIGLFLGISPRTVDHHRARILEKLEVRNVAELISLAKERQL